MCVIYRIQDREGRGPFRPGFIHRWIELRPDHDILVPWYIEFPGIHKALPRGMYLGCGVRTLDQLRRWFTASEYAALTRLHYHAVGMVADQILAEGPTQCVFARRLPVAKGWLDHVTPYPRD